MLTGVALSRTGPTFHNFPSGWIFLFVVILGIVVIFTRVYGGKRN